MKIYVVKTMRLNNFLEKEGFKKLRTRPDKFKEGYFVFLYEDTPCFREAINKYSNRNNAFK